MTNDFEYSVPPAVRRISSSFRWMGWIGFWSQIVLAVIASGVLLLSSANVSGGSPGTSSGLFFAGLGVVAAYIGAYWSFRYTRIGRRLTAKAGSKRPSPKDALQAIRIGLIISLVGMLLTLMGGMAVVGSLFAKAASQLGKGPFNSNFVTSLDIGIVQANYNTLLAHFIALAATLWLLRTVNRG